ncbi:DUF262 domain-containing protein [Lampropedia aestuarii]|uniref:DUF262 domain-containing protein n=1 Tax=Lampropedia aestuarii TaxID=2562762 RepID=UPI002468F32D|nr:DUF262 domain-containing HNH endonuclease family protein [Lampropedia aestuarii]MDH5859179.1 DUF262 domain-containing HNH endonuclease family protein [Lampropedia aestuarii]
MLSVQEILNDGLYTIPVYQRNYAWGDAEISQLIADAGDYAERYASSGNDYYIGTLVVYPRTDPQQYWEVVDGQQRLTTLCLLVSVLHGFDVSITGMMERMPLQFECRQASSKALQSIFENPLQEASKASVASEQDATSTKVDFLGANSIWIGRGIVERQLREMGQEERQKFADFLLNQVKLLRVELPPHTDLNHYFEVMNNRGEQLAKHEVLKAQLLGRLDHDGKHQEMQMLHTVWDACAVMDRSVMSGFTPDVRKRLFEPEGKALLVNGQKELAHAIGHSDCRDVAISLTQLIGSASTEGVNAQSKTSPQKTVEEDEDESKAQFGAVINFPNFLLQVLAIFRLEDSNRPTMTLGKVMLDDKHLLDQFEPLLKGDSDAIERFTFLLLRCRFLLDQYIIKSSLDRSEGSDDEHWQLQRCKFREKGNAALQWVNTFDQRPFGERLAMLQAALHVSYMLPTRKHWLQGALRWLCAQDVMASIDAEKFLMALERLTKAFVLEVGARQPQDSTATSYEDVVDRQGLGRDVNDHGFFTPQSSNAPALKALPEKLTYQRARLIDFNFLDYLLWLQKMSADSEAASEAKAFKFTSTRRSVEHLHPQTPLDGIAPWKEEDLHSFGNLCLVSHAMNSQLSNGVPDVKFSQLKSSQEKAKQSLKVWSMYSMFQSSNAWSAAGSEPDAYGVDKGSMRRHEDAVFELFESAFTAEGLIGIEMPSQFAV